MTLEQKQMEKATAINMTTRESVHLICRISKEYVAGEMNKAVRFIFLLYRHLVGRRTCSRQFFDFLRGV